MSAEQVQHTQTTCHFQRVVVLCTCCALGFPVDFADANRHMAMEKMHDDYIHKHQSPFAPIRRRRIIPCPRHNHELKLGSHVRPPWGQEDFSDLDVVLTLNTEQMQAAADQETTTADVAVSVTKLSSFPGHSAILSSSPFFRAQV